MCSYIGRVVYWYPESKFCAMEFISQTPADSNGDYTVTYLNEEGEKVVTTLNLFTL